MRIFVNGRQFFGFESSQAWNIDRGRTPDKTVVIEMERQSDGSYAIASVDENKDKSSSRLGI